MDSHIIDLPSRSVAEDEQSHSDTPEHVLVDRPGDAAEHSLTPEAPLRASTAERSMPLPRPPFLRSAYLASSAAVVVALAGMGWMFTHGHHPPAIAPAASEVGSVGSGTNETKVAQAPRHDAAQRQDFNELLGMRSATHGNPAVQGPVAVSGTEQDRPKAAAGPMPVASGTVVQASSAPPAHEVAGQTPAHPAVPGDAADRLARLQAAPMSPAEQVQVLDLVSEAAALIQKQRIELANLRHDQEQLHAKVDNTLEDFTRRLSLREASAGLAAAASVSAPIVAPAQAQAALVRVRAALASAAGREPSIRAPVPPTGIQAVGAVPPHHYRVQAASPRLAMLADDSATTGEGGQIAITVGDVLPGWGRVASISQRNTQWIAKTEHGIIE